MHAWNKVAIVGVGLIGGSVGIGLRQRGLASEIIGIGRGSDALRDAITVGAIDQGTTNLAEGVREAELAVICTPVESIPGIAASIGEASEGHCLATDAGSTKAGILAEVDRLAMDHRYRGLRFVGAHPMAGSERSGARHADGDLFRDRLVAITPRAANRPDDLDTVERLWKALGARVIRVPPVEHDEAVATTSHLPHLVAASLAAVTDRESSAWIGSGWIDSTRIASGDVEVWTQIFLENRSAVLDAIRRLDGQLQRFRAALESADRDQIAHLLQQGKQIRDALGN